MAENGQVHDSIPDPEVVLRGQRRGFTAEYKQRILDAIDAAEQPGEVGQILRREGLYSQLISKWRAQRSRGSLADTQARKRGPKPSPNAGEVERLQRENARLRARLEKAELIIDVQKKVSQLLGKSPDAPQPQEPS